MSLFKNLTIGRRFIIIALGGLILLIGTIILFHLSVERVFQDQFLAAGSSILDDKKMYIEKMFQSWADDLLLASKNPAYERYLTDTEDKISFWEQEQKKSFTYIRRLYQTDEICYIRKDGRELSRLTYDDFAGADDLSVDESAAPFFSPTLGLNQDEVFQSRPYVSGDTGRWVIATATPIISEIGEKLALLHFEIPVSWFQGMIKLSESGQIAGKKSAEGTVSDIFIINDKKEFVAHTSLAISEQKSFPGALSGNKEDAEYDAIIEKMAEGDTGGGKFSQTARELYILYAPLKLPENNINKWSIGVVLDIKKTTALALPWINSFLIVAVSGILLLAMVFGISANTARVLRQSIEQIISASSLLRASTKQISSEAQKKYFGGPAGGGRSHAAIQAGGRNFQVGFANGLGHSANVFGHPRSVVHGSADRPPDSNNRRRGGAFSKKFGTNKRNSPEYHRDDQGDVRSFAANQGHC